MELIRGLHNLRPRHRGCVATLGNFDGVHLGHQAVIGQLAEKGEELGLPATVIVFEPQPQEFFRPQNAPARLTRFREKFQALRRFSIDCVLCLRFDEKFSALEPEEFIRRVLVDGLGVRYLVVGDDFRFGYRRRGDFSMLDAAGKQFGFQVVNMHTFNIDGERVSSTRIRAALAAADLITAEKSLGRPFRMGGRVVHGDKIGRRLGIPTANIYLHRKAVPIHGIFTIEVFGIEGEPRPGVADVGTRPTMGGTKTLLEVHLLDFDDDLYRRHLNVNFLLKLRDDKKFSSLEALSRAIQVDVEHAREFFRQRYTVTAHLHIGGDDQGRSAG
jgi:riboflavin kinase/FMN adenylyltransferase